MGQASNEASHQIVGPKGDFYTHWNWDHQSKDAQWSADGAYGVNYTGDMPTETAIGSHPPEPSALMQLEFNWVHWVKEFLVRKNKIIYVIIYFKIQGYNENADLFKS